MSQKIPVNKFEWIKNTSQFNEDFLKTIMKKVMKDIFLKVMFKILKNCMGFITIYHEKLVANLHDKAENTITHKKLKTVTKL